MPTSAEIAQQIADQQSWFMQQNAMASQIGMSPMAYGGGGGPAMPAHPGMAPMPGSFSYAPGGNGMGWGNRAAAIAGGGLGAMPMAASVLGGSSPFANPISGFMMARGMGMGLGAATGAAGLMMAPLALAGAAVGSMAGGMQQQSMLGSAVGNYNFANPQAISGQGFSRQDAMGIGRQVRQLAMIPELMTSFEEVTRILPQLKNIGVMQGVRDAAEFGRRMKESITAIREVSKILGSSMADATDFFAHSRRVGFLGGNAQMQNAMNAQVTMATTGMDRNQFMQMQMQGAAQGTAIGGSRMLGAKAVSDISSRLGMQLRDNPALQATIQNITGLEGAEGVAAAAGMMANVGQRLSATGPGRFMMAGMMKMDENGNIGLDEGLMERQRRGDLSMSEIRQLGRQNMGNRSFVKKFEGHQTRLGQEFAAGGGVEGMAQMMYGAFGGDEDSARLIMQKQMGLSEEQTDLVLSGMKDESSGLAQERRLAQQVIQRNIQRKRMSPGGISSRLGRAFSNAITEPLKQAGADISGAVGSFFDEIYEDMMGDIVVQASEDSKRALVSAMAGNMTKEVAKRAFGSGGSIAGAGAVGWGSMTSQISNAFKSTEIYAGLNRIGTSGTGRTADAEFDRFRSLMGHGGSDPGDLAKQWDKWGANVGESDKAGATAIAQMAEHLDAVNEEYRNASPARRADLLRDALRRDETPEIQAMLSRMGGTPEDARLKAIAMSQSFLQKGSKAGISGSELTAGMSAHAIDLTAISTNLREAQEGVRSQFGSEADTLMKSTTAASIMDAFYSRVGARKDDVMVALRNPDSKEFKDLPPETQRAIERATPAEKASLLKAMSGNAGATGGEKWISLRKAQSNADRAANSGTLKQIADDAKTAAKEQGLSTSQVEAFSKYGKAAEALSAAYVSGVGYDAAVQGMAAATKEAIKTLESDSATPAEKEAAKRALQGTPDLQAGLARSKKVAGLSGLVNKSVSLQKLQEMTGLSKEDIEANAGRFKKDNTLTLSKDSVAALQGAAEAAAATRVGVGATTQRDDDRALQKEQLTLMRTMTAAIVSQASASGFKASEDYLALEKARKNRDSKSNATGSATPGG